ncbi:hypothetical protein Lsed01_00176 [Demequina sediminis]|uniref:Terminase n=1 Tax=Demequina sediminis TaxID=1930058 RepID=A0ABP9WF95_9MICO|nr:hypothetical protein [Demequina sediminis]BDZ60858.1 hypothetical protein GCM10025873_06490 [Demequina sediminis]
MTDVETPDGLGSRGARFWTATLEAYELSDSETPLLLEACRTLDNLDALAQAVADHGAMTVGSMGQPVVNPALTEARGQRIVLHRLLAALALPDEDGEAIPTGAQQRGKASAAKRWAGHTSERALKAVGK